MQAYNPDNKVIRHFMGNGNKSFYEDELSDRKELGYPPYSSMVNIIVSGIDEKEVKDRIMYLFAEINKITKIKFKVLGPAPAPFSRIKKYYRWHLMIKTDNIYRLNANLKNIIKTGRDSKRLKTIIDIEPVWVL
jgi:primosomal protein N' (replication factor Y)